MAFEYPVDIGDDGVVELDPVVVGQIVKIYKSAMEKKGCAPNEWGKREFFQQIATRDNFLPGHIQAVVDKNRGEMSQRDYLFSQWGFCSEFCSYHF